MRQFVYPEADTSLLVIVDMQEKLLPVIHGKEEIVRRQRILLSAASVIGMAAVVTEQYPKGLGVTVGEISENFPADSCKIEKRTFSCFGSPEFREAIGRKTVKTLIIAGIETHVCVLQTALDAINSGYSVFIPEDAVGSRSESDKSVAIRLMRNTDIVVSGSESILFMLLRDSRHPGFREISRLIK